MLMTIKDAVINLLPAKRKHSNKWISFNAPCCVHNGESRDTRGRGGITAHDDGLVSYHCFNCGYKTSYRPGRPIGYKFRKLLDWLGADDNTIQRLILEALRIKELIGTFEITSPAAPKQAIDFTPRSLPDNSISFQEWASVLETHQVDVPSQLVDAIKYVTDRNINTDKYEFYISDETDYNLNKRVIVPCYWKNTLIGYTARALVNDVKPKYHSSYEPDFVFNTNKQLSTAKFVIVVEGPFDAMAIDGVAILGSEASDTQIDIIEDLKREVIVVPDFDMHIDEKTGKKKWSGRALIETALDNDWSVSFPVWTEQYKDVAEAVEKLGALFVLKSIIDAKESNPLKIELISKRLYNTL